MKCNVDKYKSTARYTFMHLNFTKPKGTERSTNINMAESERLLSGQQNSKRRKIPISMVLLVRFSCVVCGKSVPEEPIVWCCNQFPQHMWTTLFFPGGVVYIIPQSVEILINYGILLEHTHYVLNEKHAAQKLCYNNCRCMFFYYYYFVVHMRETNKITNVSTVISSLL